jgi:hypothetical protein
MVLAICSGAHRSPALALKIRLSIDEADFLVQKYFIPGTHEMDE